MTTRLLDNLSKRANHRGLVLVRSEILQGEVRASEAELRQALAALEWDHQVRILSPLPYLVVVLEPRVWPGAVENEAKTAPKAGHVASRGYSYSFQQPIDKSKAIAIEDRGLGEGASLLQEILATLGENDAASFRAVLRHYPAATIRVALARVRATPAEKLRKSRTALFRYLIAKSK